jgi:hypothetical protein
VAVHCAAGGPHRAGKLDRCTRSPRKAATAAEDIDRCAAAAPINHGWPRFLVTSPLAGWITVSADPFQHRKLRTKPCLTSVPCFAHPRNAPAAPPARGAAGTFLFGLLCWTAVDCVWTSSRFADFTFTPWGYAATASGGLSSLTGCRPFSASTGPTMQPSAPFNTETLSPESRTRHPLRKSASAMCRELRNGIKFGDGSGPDRSISIRQRSTKWFLLRPMGRPENRLIDVRSFDKRPYIHCTP